MLAKSVWNRAAVAAFLEADLTGPQTPGRAVGAFIVRGSKSESLTRFYVIVRAGGKEFAGNQPEPVLKFLRSRRRT